MADDIQAKIEIPLLHIADPTAQLLIASGIQRIELLGTRFTMEEGFYKDRLSQKYGLNVSVPGVRERETIHRIIYEELVVGEIRQESKGQHIDIIRQLADQGAEGVILGCTEIELLIHQQDSPVPLFDTTRIHAQAAVEYALR